MLSHSLFKKRLATGAVKEKKQQKEKPNRLANFYKGILEWTLNHKWITFGGATIVLVLSFFLVPVIGVSFLPEDEQKMVIATYSPEPGQTKEEAEEIALDAETLISNREGVDIYQYSIGGGNPMGAMMGGMGGDNSALFFIGYDDDFKDFSEEGTKVIETLNENTERGEWKGLDMASMAGGSGIELYVYGENSEDIQNAVNEILPLMEDHDDLEKVESSIAE